MPRPIIIRNWLSGDIKIERSAPREHRRAFRKLLKAQAYACRRAKTKGRVNSGYRSYAEQKALYQQNMNPRTGRPYPGRPLTARPGTSNHGKGLALDVTALVDGLPFGATLARRIALKKNGLCLPVRGEGWHVERGDRWVAYAKPN